MSRRRVLAATLLAVVPLATACGAGRNAATSIKRSVAEGQSADLGSMQIRDAYLGAPALGVYGLGTDARLYLTIVNQGARPDALSAVSSTAASSVTLASDTTAPATPAVDPTATVGTAPGLPAPGVSLPLQIPVVAPVQLEPSGQYLLLQGLKRRLFAAAYAPVTFTFDNAGSITLDVPVDTGEFDSNPTGGDTAAASPSSTP